MTLVDSRVLPRAKLPVWRTAVAGYRDTLHHRRAFLTAAALPCVLVIGLEYFLPEASDVAGAGFIRFLLESLFVAFFELAWFRYLLLRRESARALLLPHPNRRLATYLAYALLLMLLHLPYVIMIYDPERLEGAPWTTYGLVAFLYIAAVYLNLRFTFTYIWIALDEDERLSASWRATRKNGLRLLMIVLVLTPPLLVILAAFGALLVLLFPDYLAEMETGTISGWAQWLDVVVSQLLLFVFYGVSSAALAQAFCQLTGWMSNRGELLERFE